MSLPSFLNSCSICITQSKHIPCIFCIFLSRWVGTSHLQSLRQLGNEFKLKCEECQKEDNYHVNDVKAKESKLIALIAFGIFIFGTGIIGYLLRDYLFMPNNPYNVLAIGGLLLIPSAVYMIMTKQERDNARRFNQYWA